MERVAARGANRRSLMVNLGGGMVTDMGGFAAATFKRGIHFINVPTTLLSAVDAAVGGKTGINFNGLKNEIGSFREADAVIISTCFLDTLPVEEIRSGYAEMLKHGLIDSAEAYHRLLECDVTSIDSERMLALLEESVSVKRRIVEEDPTEKGIRRALNLGHTAGHAFESLAMRRGNPVPPRLRSSLGLCRGTRAESSCHGTPQLGAEAVCRLCLQQLRHIPHNLRRLPRIAGADASRQKNTSGDINFTLLSEIGRVHIDSICSEDDIKTALDIFRDLMHI